MRSHRFNGRSDKVESFMPEDGSVADRASSWDIVSLDEAMETDDPSKREGGTHLKYGESNSTSTNDADSVLDFENGGSTIFCRIFFAERFAALRAACECEDSFVESLSRCVQFDASGGKSGSAFLKTKGALYVRARWHHADCWLDDRFIAKEISRLEMDALTKFAPAYFEYTRNAIHGQVRRLTHSPSSSALADEVTETDCPREDLRILQDRLQECHYRTDDAHECSRHGEPILRATVFESEWFHPVGVKCWLTTFMTRSTISRGV